MPAVHQLPVIVGREVGESVLEGEPADIPSAVGGPIDAIWDTAYEQPEYAEDPIDVPGPSVGETTDWLGVTDDADPNDGDPGFAEFFEDIRNVGPDYLDEVTLVVVVLVVFGAALWLVRPLLAIGSEVVAA